ncbi:MAG: hypothetical protein HRU12_08370 [Phaeodactylibacter sp.]|nr:hypothetical protein [Phaeodactylibacter sp.]
MAKTSPLDGFEDIERFNSSFEEFRKTSERLAKIEKERSKLNERLAQATGESAVETEKLKIQIRDARKETKRMADEALNGSDAYKKLAAESNKAQKNFKRLAAEFGVTSDQAQKANKEFAVLNDRLQEIDKAARDGRRNVGRYTDAIEKARVSVKGFNTALKATGIIAALAAILNSLKSSFESSDEGAAALEKGIGRLTIATRVFVQRTIKALPLLQDRMTLFFNNVSIKALEFKETIKELISSASNIEILGQSFSFGNLDPIDESLESITKRIAKLKEENKALLNEGDVSDVYAGMAEEVQKLTAINDKAIDKTIEFRKIEARLIQENTKLAKKQAIEQAAAEDDTSSLQEQIAARIKLNQTNKDIAVNEKKIADGRLSIAAGILKVNKESSQAQLEYAQAFEAASQVTIAAQQLEAEGIRELRRLRRDEIQLDLDFYIDDADNKKAVNERIIADETQTFERRRELLSQNERLIENSFKEQTRAVNAFQKMRGKNEIDFSALVKEESSKVIADRLKAAGVDEATSTRVLEIIRERRTALQDLSESRRDLNESERESNRVLEDSELIGKALNKLKEEGADAEQVLADLEKERTDAYIKGLEDAIKAEEDAYIKGLEKELKAAEDGSQKQIEMQKELDEALLNQRLGRLASGSKKQIEMQKELNEALLDQQLERIEKEKQAEDEARKQRQKQIEAGISLAENAYKEYSKRRLDDIDKEADALTDRRESLQKLADDGNKEAAENLALTQKREAEIAKKREAEIQKQAATELVLAGTKLYTAKVTQGDENAQQNTILEIVAMQEFITALGGVGSGAGLSNLARTGATLLPGLAGFYEGTENVAKSLQANKVSEGRDGYVIRVDGDERILNPEQNARIPAGMSNDTLARIAEQHHFGAFDMPIPVFTQTVDTSSIRYNLEQHEMARQEAERQQYSGMLNQLKAIQKSIENKETYLGRDYDATRNAVTESIKRGNKRINNHYKNIGFK